MKNIYAHLGLVILLALSFVANAQYSVTIGSGTSYNSNQNYPTPYGNWYWGSKEQYLIKASELIQAGASTGNIMDLAFNVAVANSVALQGFTIKMGTTSDTSLYSNFYSNLTQVYSTTSYTEFNGWNNHSFQTPFAWDGYSNIIVETCFNNNSYTYNASVYNSNTSFVSTLSINNDAYGICETTGGNPMNVRPNMKFTLTQPAANNMVMLALNMPNPTVANSPNGNQPISFYFVNRGTQPQSNFTVGYSINGGSSFVTANYPDTVFPADTVLYTFSTTANMSIGGLYPCKFFVSNPGDQYPMNDTLIYNLVFCNPLSGTFTLGAGTSNDFHSFNELAGALQMCGIGGPVNVLVESGTYNEQVSFNQIPGSSLVNTVTISSLSGNPDDVIVQFGASDVNNAFLFRLNGTDNFIIKNMTFKPLDYYYNTGIVLSNQANNNLIYNNKIIAQSSGDGSLIFAYNSNNNKYRKNIISGGRVGIYSEGDSYNFSFNTVVDSNEVSNFIYNGITVQSDKSSQIIANKIYNTHNYNNLDGISLISCKGNIEVISNDIYLTTKFSSSTGIKLQYCNNLGYDTVVSLGMVANNMINIDAGYDYSTGIYDNNCDEMKFYYNTVSIKGNGTNSKALHSEHSSGITNGIEYKNNIFSNFASGYTGYFNYPTSLIISNYNNYYAVNSSSFAYYNGNKNTLAELRTASNQEMNSVSYNPNFVASNDLHCTSIGMANKGTYLADILTDIDGQIRSTTTPDMGADEYTPPQNNLTLVNIYSTTIPQDENCNLGSAETLVAVVVNNGTATQTSIPFRFKLNNYTTVNETWTGSLATNDTLTYLFTATGNFSQAGKTHISVYTALSNDENKNDDTLSYEFYTYKSITTLPFADDFEVHPNVYFHTFDNPNSEAVIDTIHGLDSPSGIYMKGGDTYNGWNYTGSDILSNIQNNNSHFASVSTCPFNATGYTNLRMSFKIRKNSSEQYSNFFFIKINDSLYAKTLSGDSVFTGNIYDNTNLIFNLNPFVGGNIKISLCAIMRSNGNYNGIDDIEIDNFRLYVPQNNDLGVVSIESSGDRCGSVADSLFLKIKNYGLLSQSNFPVHINFTWDTVQYNFTKTYTNTLAPEAEDWIYMGVFNGTKNTWIDLKSYTNLSTDQNHTNDSMNISEYLEIYKEIPHIENFENQNIDWNYSDFYIQDLSFMGLGKILAIESYGGGELPAHFEVPGSYSNEDSYAFYQERIGFVDQNSFLVFDYRFFSNQGFSDSIIFVVNNNCNDDEDYQMVYALTNSNNTIVGNWNKIFVPLAAFAGQTVKIGLVKRASYTQSSYVIGFDNIGILNATPINLGPDTVICPNENYVLNTGLTGNGYTFSWQGPGISSSNTGPTLTVTNPGIYTVTVTDSMGMITSDAVNVSVRQNVTGNIGLYNSSICAGDSLPIYINVFGSFPIVFNWTDGITTHTDTTGNYYNMKNFSPTSTSTYALLTLTDVYGCSSTINDSVTVTVHQLPVVSASGLAGQYCKADAADSLFGVPAGGLFSGSGITGTIFNPSISNSGPQNILYKFNDVNGCQNIDTLTTIVYNTPTVSIVSTPKAQYCSTDNPENFLTYPSGGTFSGSTGMVGSLFNPSLASIGSNTVVYTFVDAHNCSSTDTVSFMVNASPIVNITSTLLTAYCADAAAVNLVATPSGGTFSGNGVVANAFNPALASTGQVQIIYNYINASGCASSDTISTTVNPLPTVLINNQFAASYCQNGTSINLSGYPTGGTFSGNGVIGNVFNTASASLGTKTITYTYSDGNGCTKSATASFVLNAMPVVSITTSLNAAYCADAAAVNLVATPSGGTFSGNGVVGNAFYPALATLGPVQIIYSYTNASGCTSSDTLYTVVNPKPIVLITNQLAAGYCQDGSSINLSGYPSGGAFSGNGVTGVKFYTDSVTAGAHNIIYSYTNIYGCSNTDTTEIIVNPLPTVTLSGFSDVCSNISQVSLTGGSPVGGVYSGGSVNSGSGVFYPAVSGIGLNTITYSYTNANGCNSSASSDIRVIGQPTASFSLPSVVCKSDTINVVYTGNGSVSSLFNWNFSNAQALLGSGVGPYTMRWDTAGIKAISLTVTDSGCVSNTTFNYTNVMDAIAMVTSVGGSTACYQDSVLLFANSGPGFSFQWFDTTGTMTSSNDTLPFYYALGTGSYYAIVTNNYGCIAVSANVGVTVYPEILSDFTMPATACKNDIINIQLNGSADTNAVYSWSFGNGVIANGSGAGPYGIIWNTDGLKDVNLMIEKYGCSSALTTKTIDIVTTPAVITALGATTFCNGGSVTLYPNSGANLSYEWFKDSVSLNNYNSYFTANQSGSYSVKVINTLLGCENTSAPIIVTVNPTDFNLAFTANNTNFTLPPFIVNISNQTIDTASYYWNWSMGDGGISTVANPMHQYAYDGTYTVGVIAQNINTGCYDTLVKTNYISCNGGSSNPCSLVAAISPSGPKTICPGDSILLTATNNPTSTYQWLKDGVLITGADTTTYWAKQTGNYQIMVTNSICSQFSNPFSLTVYNTITPIIASNGSIMPCSNDSMELYVTSSFNNYLWSNGAVTSDIFVKNSGNYTVTVTDINGCKTISLPKIVNASLLQTPEICIVGVDSATNANFIVWERQADPLIDSFRVYRESTIAGVYNLLGSTSISSPGYMLDPTSNPKQQAYRYKITAIDTCGMETPPSNYHKTIHLSINAGLNGSWNLIWSHYVGFNFGSYRIYRGYDTTALQPLTQIQSTLNSYTDLNPPTGKVYYQIEVVSPHPCYPDSLYAKAKTNYNTSRSNNVNTTMAPNIGLTEMMITDYSVNIYPNPNNGMFEFELISAKDDRYRISVRNVLGQEIYLEKDIDAFGRITKTIDLGKPAPGVYYLVVENNNQRLVKKIVVN